jgi:myo-inositol 2-dehydrogenase/D-chiro-inositol 1-dehydrogenase
MDLMATVTNNKQQTNKQHSISSRALFLTCGFADQRIEVLGEKGMIQAMNKQPTTVIMSLEDGVHTDPYLYSFPQRYDQAYNIELDHFADVVLKGVPVRIGHEDVRKVSIIADAAEQSARTGTVVRPKFN